MPDFGTIHFVGPNAWVNLPPNGVSQTERAHIFRGFGVTCTATRGLQPGAWLAALCLVIAGLAWSSIVSAGEPIAVNGSERGVHLGQRFQLWHDASGEAGLDDAMAAYHSGKFEALGTRGSTGLQPGAFWSRFELENTRDQRIDLRLEYIDHQLIYLNAYQRRAGTGDFRQLVDLSLYKSFDSRPVSHHRFVVPITLEGREGERG